MTFAVSTSAEDKGASPQLAPRTITYFPLRQVVSERGEEHVLCGVRVASYTAPGVAVDVKYCGPHWSRPFGPLKKRYRESDGPFIMERVLPLQFEGFAGLNPGVSGVPPEPPTGTVPLPVVPEEVGVFTLVVVELGAGSL